MNRHRSRIRAPRTLAAALIALAGAGPSFAQAINQGAPPLLPEGTELLSMRGYFARSLRDPGMLVFRFEDAQRGGAQRTLVALPCAPVDAVRASLDDPTPGSAIRFEVTGTVYRYDRRSFLLPSVIVPLRTPEPPGMLARVAPPGLRPPPAPEDQPRPPALAAYAGDLAAELATPPAPETAETQAGAIPAPAQAAASGLGALDDGLADRLERGLEEGIASSATAARRPEQRVEAALLLPAGERFQDRRATVLRDPMTGAWRARFDTGRPGEGRSDGAEASLELLPSKALEELERLVRQAPIGTDYLLSGEVVTTSRRSFVVVSRAVKVPADRFVTP